MKEDFMRAPTHIAHIVLLIAVISLCPDRIGAQVNILDSVLVQQSLAFYNMESLNTPALEFSPTVRDSQLYYVSSLNTEGGEDPEIAEPWFIWFRAPLPARGIIPDVFYSFIPIGKQPYHLGPLDFSTDGNTLFYTANPKHSSGFKNRSGRLPLQLYVVRKENGTWGAPKRLSFVREEHDYCHPSWDEENKRLYFSSSSPDGYGGMDIYYVEQSADGWSHPVNVGKGVNTGANEVFPFISRGGALFYSSDRRNTLDVYLSQHEDGRFEEGHRLPAPFSSSGDDLGFYLNEDQKTGYMSSNREGGWGKDDLYAFESSVDLLERKEDEQKWNFLVWDVQTDRPVEDVELRPFPVDKEDIVQWPDAFKKTTVTEDGDRYTAYRMKDPRTLRNSAAETGEDGQARLTLDRERRWKVFFTAPDYHMVEWTMPDEHPGSEVLIELKSSRCIPYEIVVKNEAGQTLDNARLDWEAQCEESFRANDRHGACLYPNCRYQVIANASGYHADTMRFVARAGAGDTSVVRITLQSAREHLPSWTGKISRGEVIVMENIYYNYNEASIRPGAAEDLEVLAEILKEYPSIHIELIAHTDARGDKYYNLKLSLRRAESAKEFLVERGIEPERIRALGYGESQIRNRCEDGVECSEEEHEYNRRTEVRITSIGEEVDIRYRKNLPE